MGEIRRLNLSDLPAIADLLRPHSTYMGVDKVELHRLWNNAVRLSDRSPDFDTFFLKDLEKYHLSETGTVLQMFGFFAEGRLKSAMGIRKLSRYPSWAINKMVSEKGDDLKASGLPEVYEYCINHCEAQGLGEYFTCVSQDLCDRHERIWRAHVPAKKRYVSYTEEIIPPFSVPCYQELNRLVRPSMVTMVIRRHVLKEEYRPQLFADRRRAWLEEIRKWNPNAILEATH